MAAIKTKDASFALKTLSKIIKEIAYKCVPKEQ